MMTCYAGGPFAVAAGQPHTFSKATVIGATGPVGYLWSFGDGTYDSTLNPTHVYAKAGTYHPKLLVMDRTGIVVSNKATATVTAVTTVPLAPTNLTAASVPDGVSLGWGASAGATSYTIYRSTTDGNTGLVAMVTGITGTTYVDKS